MTFKEILIACGGGTFPKVRCLHKIEYATSDIGVITTIKNNGKYRGVGVTFPGCNWETWFIDSDDIDKRAKYIRNIELINP